MSNNKTITGWQVRFENILIYLVPIVGFIFAFIKKAGLCDEAKFNYKQSGSAFIIYAASSIVMSIFGSIQTALLVNGSAAGFIFTVLVFIIGIIPTVLSVFVIITLINGFCNKKFEIPVINKIGNLIWK